MNTYTIFCRGCGKKITQDLHQIQCNACEKKALLYTDYRAKLKIRSSVNNLYRYRDWLPTDTFFPDIPSISGCYRSKNLARFLGLENLWILFSGYWPAKGAFLESCSFKEFEAIGVLSRAYERTQKTLILSSAGNTALSMIHICLKTGIPAIVVAPEAACSRFFTTVLSAKRPVLLIGIKDARYSDCMDFVDALCDPLPDVVREGGSYNVARRDFLGVPVIHGINKIGEIPDHYFQAVGSGTGAISAFEANRRLVRDRGYGTKIMKLNLAQNNPFTPIADAWENGRRDYAFLSNVETRQYVREIVASVLSNTKPPYSVAGGVFDVLSLSHGATYRVDNREIIDAKFSFERQEGVDIQYPSAVALAALRQAVLTGRVRRQESVLLHMTGGGDKLLRENLPVHLYEPSIILEKNELAAASHLISKFIGDQAALKGE